MLQMCITVIDMSHVDQDVDERLRKRRMKKS